MIALPVASCRMSTSLFVSIVARCDAPALIRDGPKGVFGDRIHPISKIKMPAVSYKDWYFLTRPPSVTFSSGCRYSISTQ